MRRRLPGIIEEYELAGAFDVRRDETVLSFDSADEAAAFLWRFLRDPTSRATLWRAAIDVERRALAVWDDVELLERVASLVTAGWLRIVVRPIRREGGDGAGPAGEDAPAAPAAPAKREDHTLRFEFATDTGLAIEDPAGCVLVHPDGTEEPCTLSQGRLERQSVAPGRYTLRFRYIREAGWSRGSAYAGQTVGLWATSAGFKDGDRVSFRIGRLFQSREEPPVEELTGTVSANTATAEWSHEQKVGEPPGGEFVVEASIGRKRAVSPPLLIQPFPLDDTKGIQERLKHLAYYDGPIDGRADGATADALKAFQRDHGLPETGTADERTRGELAG